MLNNSRIRAANQTFLITLGPYTNRIRNARSTSRAGGYVGPLFWGLKSGTNITGVALTPDGYILRSSLVSSPKLESKF